MREIHNLNSRCTVNSHHQTWLGLTNYQTLVGAQNLPNDWDTCIFRVFPKSCTARHSVYIILIYVHPSNHSCVIAVPLLVKTLPLSRRRHPPWGCTRTELAHRSWPLKWRSSWLVFQSPWGSSLWPFALCSHIRNSFLIIQIYVDELSAFHNSYRLNWSSFQRSGYIIWW